MNLFLAGGTGYIASHLATVLTEIEHQVVLFDNFFNSKHDVVKSLEKIMRQRTMLVSGSVCNTALLVQTIKSHKTAAVIHFSGLKVVGESVASPIDYYANTPGVSG